MNPADSCCSQRWPRWRKTCSTHIKEVGPYKLRYFNPHIVGVRKGFFRQVVVGPELGQEQHKRGTDFALATVVSGKASPGTFRRWCRGTFPKEGSRQTRERTTSDMGGRMPLRRVLDPFSGLARQGVR